MQKSPWQHRGGEDVAEMKVTLASQEAYARAGLERHYSLSKLRFSPQQKEDGSFVIKVTSSEPIREPFLDFMIEVHWPQGRMQREFTVLLDPPANFQESEASNEELPEAEPYPRSYERPIQRQPAADPVVRPKPPRRPAATQANVIETPQTPVETGPITGSQYGPVNRNETLWSIAKQFNQDASISQQKMLSALYKANPHAFYRNNINALKAGETITIPDRDTIVRLTGAPSGPPMLRSSGKLRAEAPKREEESGIPSGEAATGSPGQLKLIAPSSGKSKEEQALEAAAESVKRENEEIRKRLADFEQKLSGMQRLLTLKDEQIATLQAAQKGSEKQASPTPAVPTTTPTPSQLPSPGPATAIPTAPPTAAKPTAPTPAPSLEVARPQQPPLVPGESKELPKPATQPTAIPPQQAIPTPPPVTQIPKPEITPPPKPPVVKPPVQQAKPAQPATPAKQEEPGFLTGLLDQSSYMIGGATGMLLVALVLAVWVKRRRAAMIDEAESILTLSDREKTLQLKRTQVPLEASPSSLSEQSTTARSSFLSEFTPSDFDALGGEMEEVDPISEADVYLAYGRYKQAEELIRSAIAQNPERDECKLKLLEIHYATENAQAFEKFAEELALTHRDTKPEFWEKVVEMGEELCPGSPLFGDGKEPVADTHKYTPPSAPVEENAETGEEDFFYGTEAEETYPHAITTAPQASQHNDEKESPQAAVAYDFFSTESLEFDSKKGHESEPDIRPTSNILSFDKAQANIEEGPMDLQDKSLDDILAELGVLSETSQRTPTSQEQQENLTDNGIEYALELDHITEEDKPLQYNDDTTDYLGLTEMDEQETKLDLAKAYFDMGDAESARVILEHVTQHGNDAQKDEAWTLLGRLTKKEVNRR